jgi:cation transport ATPase
MGGGLEQPLETADVALMSDDLTRRPAAIGSPERRASI